jgi:pimeloyl-ACP methyl ester carboxylesterase
VTDATGIPGFEERFADVKGVRMRYFVAGEGRPLLLVHGLGGAASNWIELAPALARGRRVLVPELPGHGGSSPLPAASTLSPFADRVAILAEREGMLPAPVVGHSLGGVVALRMALRWPESVTGLVLAAPAGISSASQRAELAITLVTLTKPAKLISPQRRIIARVPWLRYPVFGYWEVSDPPALSARATEGFLAGPGLHTDVSSAGRALVADDPRRDLAGVGCPCLLLQGARDHMVPLADGFEYARRLRAPIRVVPDCGHLLIGERPDACLDAIEGFLARLESEQADEQVHEHGQEPREQQRDEQAAGRAAVHAHPAAGEGLRAEELL